MPIKNVITVAQKTWVISEIKESKKTMRMVLIPLVKEKAHVLPPTLAHSKARECSTT